MLVAHDIGRPWVIDELRPTIWIFADRPGVQFFAEVTLPRTLDPRTAKPLTTNIYGTAYTAPGRWQQLEIVDLPRILARQVRVLRSQLAVNVDGREANVSRVLLNIYGGPGVTNVWTDDLEVFGHVPSGMNTTVPGARRGLANAASPVGGGPPEPPPREVKLALSVLKINDYPIFPRSIEYRGERLAFLKQLGFNTIWLGQVPSPAFLAEARRLGLWLVCPPPEGRIGLQPVATPDSPQGRIGLQPVTTPDSPQGRIGLQPVTTPDSPQGRIGLQPVTSPDAPAATIGPEFEPVLVWDLGHGLTGESLDAVRQRADQVRLADSRSSRPLICPVNNLRGYSRLSNNLLLLIDRRPLGTSLEMPNYGNWVSRQPLLALPGTPVWTTVQTQAGLGLRRQFAALAAGQAPPTVVGPEQIRLLVYTAICSGSRGLLFLSESSLEAPDGETRQRVATLQLLNQELQTIEPWAAGGNWIATVEASQPLVSGAILLDHRRGSCCPCGWPPARNA